MEKKEKEKDKKTSKKIYYSPKLVIYGDIRRITQTTGTMGNWDGALGKTGV